MSTEITAAMQAGYDAQVRTATITRGTASLAWNMPWDRALTYARTLADAGDPVTVSQPARGIFPARTITVR